MAREPMPISSLWFQGAMLTYLLGFTVLGLLAYLVYRDQPRCLQKSWRAIGSCSTGTIFSPA